MKIDVHVHTKKCKQGDATTREITPSRFRDILLATDVKVLAITNHNVFDINQYNEICSEVENEMQVWPGVELDIMEGENRGHLLVIVSPNKAKEFSKVIELITMGMTPDTFNISIDSTLQNFDSLEPLYIAHYQQKKPDITEEDLNKLISATANKSRVLKEVTNSISAVIYISHCNPSIYGSDVHD